MNDEMDGPVKTVIGMDSADPDAAPGGPADLLTLRLGSTDSGSATLYGFYNINAARAGRVGGSLPGPILAVVVIRETGLVFAMRMLNDGDMPPFYDPDARPTIVKKNAPEGAKLPSEKGHFRTDLNTITELSQAAMTLDGFLWLEDVASDMATLALPARDPAALPLSPRRSDADSGPAGEAPSLTFDPASGTLRGTAPGPHVSLIAISLPDQEIAHSVLSKDGAEGLSFEVPVRDMLRDAENGDRILAFAVAQGQKSDLADGIMAN